MAALHSFQVSEDLFAAVGDVWGVAFAQQWLAFVHTAQGNHVAALAAAERAGPAPADRQRLGGGFDVGCAGRSEAAGR